MEQQPTTPVAPAPLGTIPVKEHTFEHDVIISERFQNFSTELLRLSLLAIGAMGFLLKEFLFKDPRPPLPRGGLTCSLILLFIAAATALLHRYAGSNSLAFHLQSLRHYYRDDPHDFEQYKSQRKGRQQFFKYSKLLIILSGTCLLLGAASVIWIFIKVT